MFTDTQKLQPILGEAESLLPLWDTVAAFLLALSVIIAMFPMVSPSSALAFSLPVFSVAQFSALYLVGNALY